MRILRLGRREIGVFRTADGALFAVRNVCPHKGAPICRGKVTGTMLPSAPGCLEYGMEERVLRCPWHGMEFDVRTGEALFGETNTHVRTYPVSVREGVVEISLR